MPIDVLLIPAGAFLAALCVGAAGFGDALILAAIWLHVLAPGEAVPLILAVGVVIHGFSLLRLWRHLDFSPLVPFLVGGALGVPVGSWFLAYADPEIFRLCVGVFLVAYSGFNLVHPDIGHVRRGGRALDGAAGLIGGITGGLAGLSGIVATLWATLRGWPKAKKRGLIQPFVFIINGMAFGWLAGRGMVGAETLTRFAVCLPAIAAGAWLGLRLYGTLDEAQFGRIVLMGLMVMGLTLIVF